jgi:hypothetical protein
MLIEVKNASGSTVVASYTYDPFKRLAMKTVGATKTRYVYSGTQLMEEYDCSTSLPGTLQRRYPLASLIAVLQEKGQLQYCRNFGKPSFPL